MEKQDPNVSVQVKGKNDHNPVINDSWFDFDIHGLKPLKGTKSKLGKLFWVCIMLGCSSFLVNEIIKNTLDYINQPIVTKYRIISKESMEVPDIYICPYNYVNDTYLQEHPEVLSYIELLRGVSPGKDDSHTPDQWTNSAPTAYPSLEETKRAIINVAYEIDKFFLSCSIRQMTFLETLECSDYITPILDSTHGLCYLFNASGRLNMTMPTQGMMFSLHLHRELFPKNSSVAPSYSGLNINIDKPYAPYGQKIVMLKPASYNRVDLRTENLQLLNVQSGSQRQLCMENSHLHEYEVLKVPKYAQLSCQLDCIMAAAYEKCRCVHLMDPIFLQEEVVENATYCSDYLYHSCMQPLIHYDNSTMADVEACRHRCLQPCELSRYQIDASAVNILDSMTEKKFGTEAENIIQVHVNFPYLEYANYEQEYPQSTDALISNLGGQVGLWSGASMLTLIQIPSVICLLCWCKCCNTVKKRHERGKNVSMKRSSLCKVLE